MTPRRLGIPPVLFALATAWAAACARSPSAPPAPRPAPEPGPAPTPEPGPVTEDVNCTEPRPAADYACIQDCGPPVARDGDPPLLWRWLSPADAEKRRKYGCPRCLPEDTRIATPAGDRPVSELAVGDAIWTQDAGSRRVAGVVVHVGSTPVSGGHRVVRLTLADGRSVAASPEHPDPGGRALTRLAVGDAIDGSTIMAIEFVAYTGSRTFDVLPSGTSGVYWADGVPLGSTFAHQQVASSP